MTEIEAKQKIEKIETRAVIKDAEGNVTQETVETTTYVDGVPRKNVKVFDGDGALLLDRDLIMEDEVWRPYQTTD